jgi:hypothetical protein
VIQSDQFKQALTLMSPDVKKTIRRALKDVEAGIARDVHALRPPLEGFSTLRVGRWRIIHRWHGGELCAEFLDNRSDDYRRAEKSLGS